MTSSQALATSREADAIINETRRDHVQLHVNATGEAVRWKDVYGQVQMTTPKTIGDGWTPRTIEEIETHARKIERHARAHGKRAQPLAAGCLAGESVAAAAEQGEKELAALFASLAGADAAHGLDRSEPINNASTADIIMRGQVVATSEPANTCVVTDPVLEAESTLLARPATGATNRLNSADTTHARTTYPAIAAGGVYVAASADRFPIDVAAVSAEGDAAADLAEMCREVVKSSEDYERTRVAYCQASIQLNLRGRIAPAFRPAPKVKAKKGDRVHTTVLRDQLVIDYHWCHAAHMDLAPPEDFHAAFWDLERDFAFQDAWNLSCRKWRGAYRADEALGLSAFEQCQTMRLRGIELETRIKEIDSGYRESNGRVSTKRATAMRKIREWTERQSRMKPLQRVYECLWTARELLGPGNRHRIPHLLALMLGAPVLDRKTIRDKLVTLDKNVQT